MVGKERRRLCYCVEAVQIFMTAFGVKIRLHDDDGRSFLGRLRNEVILRNVGHLSIFSLAAT